MHGRDSGTLSINKTFLGTRYLVMARTSVEIRRTSTCRIQVLITVGLVSCWVVRVYRFISLLNTHTRFAILTLHDDIYNINSIIPRYLHIKDMGTRFRTGPGSGPSYHCGYRVICTHVYSHDLLYKKLHQWLDISMLHRYLCT